VRLAAAGAATAILAALALSALWSTPRDELILLAALALAAGVSAVVVSAYLAAKRERGGGRAAGWSPDWNV